MSPDVIRALQRARLLYLTTYSRSGKSGTVPIWFFLHENAIYFCTQRDSLKVRRLRQTGYATLHIGQRHGPGMDCTADILDHNPALQTLLVQTYRKRYWLRWLFLGPRLRRGLARGDEVIIRLTPASETISA
jgi:uncharacterized protein